MCATMSTSSSLYHTGMKVHERLHRACAVYTPHMRGVLGPANFAIDCKTCNSAYSLLAHPVLFLRPVPASLVTHGYMDVKHRHRLSLVQTPLTIAIACCPLAHERVHLLVADSEPPAHTVFPSICLHVDTESIALVSCSCWCSNDEPQMQQGGWSGLRFQHAAAVAAVLCWCHRGRSWESSGSCVEGPVDHRGKKSQKGKQSPAKITLQF